MFLILSGYLSAQNIAELVSNRLLTGPEPDEQFWQKASELGIKTLISVDGISPQVQKAKQHGFSYIHLPISYDEIDSERTLQLASALKHAEAPIYLHCHHGKHRGPTAAVVAALANNLISRPEGLAYLENQQTSKDYQGLWASARKTKELTEIPYLELPSKMSVDDLTETMAQIDRVWKNVKLFRKNKWLVPKTHPDLVLKNELSLLYEFLFESERLQLLEAHNSQEQEEIHQLYEDSLEVLENFKRISSETHPSKATQTSMESAFQKTKANCKSCHQQFRD